MSVASELATLAQTKEDIGAAIVEKGGSVPAVFADYGDAVRALPSGGESVADATLPVKFVDYDGTLLYSYSLEDAADLSELPDLPSHDGLANQGWNYTLAQMKSQVSSTRSCTVGCNYVTTDGATRIRIKVRDPTYSDFRINFTQSVNNGVEVDWVRTHTYSPSEYPTEYTIVMTPNSGTLRFTTNICGYANQNTTNPAGGYCSMIESVKLGAVTSVGAYAFSNCFSLQSISISSGMTSIGTYAFSNCYSLQSISIPSGVRSIGNYAFSRCHSLQSVSISSGVTSIGTYAFSNCYSLQSVSIPSGVTSVGNYVFSYCFSLQSISIPSGVTSIGTSAFSNCYSLQSVSISSGVTSIGTSAFSNCFSLQSISIPSGVTSIGTSAFNSCYSIRVYDFSNHASVPSLSNVNAFGNTSTTKKIIVPDALYDTWKAASNWSSTTNNIVNCIVKASEA